MNEEVDNEDQAIKHLNKTEKLVYSIIKSYKENGGSNPPAKESINERSEKTKKAC